MPPKTANTNVTPPSNLPTNISTTRTGPIIYQQSSPNFQQEPKKNPIKKILELDLGLHLAIIILLLVLVMVTIGGQFSFLPKNNNSAAQAAAPVASSLPIAAEKRPVFINEQVISVEKAFNSNPSSIKFTAHGPLKKEVLGFLPYWSVDKVDQIDIRMLTAVSYFGLEVGGDGEIMKQSTQDAQIGSSWDTWQNDPKLVSFIRKLKKNNTKIYLTLKAFNNDNIEKLVTSDVASQNFINNALYQVSSKSLDGINIDFEYVGTPTEEVRDKFSILISNLNKELKRQYPKSTLTIDTYATAASENKLFDIGLLSQNADALVIMGYDYHTPSSATPGAVAPLGGSDLNLSNSISSYLDKVDPQKIILAVPYYGYGWASEGDSNVILSYAEIIDATKNININWDEESQAPWYKFNEDGKQYTVYFENTRSLGLKYDLVTSKNLQGIGIWALGLDGRNQDLNQLISDKFSASPQ